MAGKQAPQYKRSWKNLLLNKRYQLRFTLFMVGVSASLMTGLGVWVMKEANEATTVAKIRVRGEACPKVPEIVEVPTLDTPAAPMKLDEPTPTEAGSAATTPAPAGSGAAAEPAKPQPEPAKVASSDPAKVADNNAQAFFKLGQTYEQLKQVDAAKKAYETVVQKYPANFQATQASQALQRLNRK